MVFRRPKSTPEVAAVTMMAEGKDMAPAGAADRLEDRDSNNRSTLTVALLRIAVLAVALLVWQFIAGALDIEFFISKPTEIWAQLQDWVTTGYLWDNLGVTLQATLYGFLLGAVAGIAVGFLLGLIQILGKLLD